MAFCNELKNRRFLVAILVLFCHSRHFVAADGNTEIVSLENGIYLGKFHHGEASEGTTLREEKQVIIDEKRCTYHQLDGICFGEVTCHNLKGKWTHFCSGLSGVCCIFERFCGGKTAMPVAHFRNKNWPDDEVLKPSCTLNIVKGKNICGMSLTLKKLNLPGKVGSCSHSVLTISGIPGRRLNHICGSYSGATYIFNISSSSEVFVELTSRPYLIAYKSSWNLIFQQIPCSEFTYEVLPEGEDGLFPGLAPIADTPRPTPTTTTRPLPPTTPHPSISGHGFSRCGVKGLAKQRDEATSRKDDKESLSILERLERIRIKDENETIGEPEFLPNVTITKWGAPELTNSIFHELQGKHNAVIDQRITYGEEAAIGEFPWQAALHVGQSFHCGGSILSDQYILTAAHCVSSYENNFENLRILLGAFNVRNPLKSNAETYRIRQVHVHKSYSRRNLQNDIAILKLSRRIHFTKTIRPVCLPPKNINVDGKLAYVTGWGRDETKKLMSKLRKLQAAIVTNEVCGERWGNVGARKGFIVDSMMCMDSQHGDSCNGDSGGPTVIEDSRNSGHFVQVGIVSFGSGSCTDKRLPGVYTRVSYYRDWIDNHMKN